MTIKFTEEHEWVRVEGGIGVVGITDYAQKALGDVVYVELPEIGRHVTKGDETAVVESVKAASEVYAPVAGEVIAANEILTDTPATVNSDPLGEGWFFKLKIADASELDAMMDQESYDAYVKDLH